MDKTPAEIADDLITQHIEARGRMDKIMAIRTLAQIGIEQAPNAQVLITPQL